MAATVIAVYSTKGGVGKTTTAVNLAWQAASEGREVLLWDLDPQAAATWLLQVKPHLRGGAEALVRGRKPANKAVRESKLERIDVLPADESYRDLDIALDAAKKPSSRVTEALRPLRRHYDVIILDTPPGASLVAENALRAADVVVLPSSLRWTDESAPMWTRSSSFLRRTRRSATATSARASSWSAWASTARP